MSHGHRQEATEPHTSTSVKHRPLHGSSASTAYDCPLPSQTAFQAYEIGFIDKSNRVLHPSTPIRSRNGHMQQAAHRGPHNPQRWQSQAPPSSHTTLQQHHSTFSNNHQLSSQSITCSRPVLASSLRWLQLCLLALLPSTASNTAAHFEQTQT